MKRAIVTGATSMLGIATIEACVQNDVEVLAIVREDCKKLDRLPNTPLVKMQKCNIEDYDNYQPDQQYDVLYHFSWTNTDKEGRQSTEIQLNNVQYTLDAVKLAYRTGCQKFIGAGSQAEFGLLDLECISPDSPVNPITPYGISKYAAGKLANIKTEQLGMDCLWVRVFSVYGKYDRNNSLISSTIQKLLRGEKPSFTPAQQRWDFLNEKDAGEAFYAMGQKATGHKVYCLGSGKGEILQKYIETIRDHINPEIDLGIGDLPYPENCVMNLCADVTGLMEDTGWEPVVKFEEGIAGIVEYIQKEDG